VIADHPVVGVGAGNFQVVAPEYATETFNLRSVHLVVDEPHVAHSTYLGVFADLGVVGLLAFVLVVTACLMLALRSAKLFAMTRDGELELVSRAVVVGLIGMLTALVFLSGQYEKQLWLLLGFAVALHALARRRLREAQAPAGMHPEPAPFL
jgi:O-antigen ligase